MYDFSPSYDYSALYSFSATPTPQNQNPVNVFFKRPWRLNFLNTAATMAVSLQQYLTAQMNVYVSSDCPFTSYQTRPVP